MDELLKWAGQYSAPVVILLACGAALIFAFQHVVEKAVEGEFEKRNKRIELLLQRRSNFEEKVLLDQYDAVTKLQLKLANIGADLNRLRSGIEVEGLMKGKDIVPLSEVSIDLQAKRFLLKEALSESLSFLKYLVLFHLCKLLEKREYILVLRGFMYHHF